MTKENELTKEEQEANMSIFDVVANPSNKAQKNIITKEDSKKKTVISEFFFKNVLGLEEIKVTPSKINIFKGKSKTGKTSVINAIEAALSNKKVRTEIIKNGEDEATMFLSLSDGTTIDRVKSKLRSDKFSVKGENVQGSPQAYLSGLFNEKQFRPVSFVEASPSEQNKILLSMVEIGFTMEDIQDWFGEIPKGVDLNNHILQVLDDIQSDKGYYYTRRQNVNREKKIKEGMIVDLVKELPENYDGAYWESYDLDSLYQEVAKDNENNSKLARVKDVIAKHDINKQQIDIDCEQEKARLEKIFDSYREEKAAEKTEIDNQIHELIRRKDKIDNEVSHNKTVLAQRLTQREERAMSDKNLLEEKFKLANGEIESLKEIDVTAKNEQIAEVNEKRTHLSSWSKIKDLRVDIDSLTKQSEEFTKKIEKARELPGELLQKASCPIEGVSVKDGKVLINDLPIDNLSTGEQLQLSVKIAKELSGDLGIVLVDRFECLDLDNQNIFLEECKKSDLQFFITQVTNEKFQQVSYE